MKIPALLIAAALSAAFIPSSASTAAKAAAPDLDLMIRYYSKVLTPEGVTREARFEEAMLRRPGHVWTARKLPASATAAHAPEPQHAHFNHVVVPRHVLMDSNALRLEYVDAHDRQVVAIPAAEYENVSFDGSWAKAFYLVDPALLKTMPLSGQASPVAGARWHERRQQGSFQRVLWDDARQIALIIESGDQAATFYNRVEVQPQATLSKNLPWQHLKGYAQKEYSDFLD
jgi:hypothetical protein